MIKVCKSVPAYGKLHTGLYIAAFQDALNRARQLRNIKNNPLGRFPIRYCRKYECDRRKYEHYEDREFEEEDGEERGTWEMEEARAKRGADLVKTVGDTLLSTPRIRVQLPEEKAEYFERVQRSDAFPMDPEGRHEKESEKLTLKLHSPQNSVYKVVIHTEEHTDARVGNRCVFELYKRDREVQYAFNEYERYAWLRKRKFQGCVGYLIVE